ncbi:MAG: DMT family transporter [Candidatus Woesebacteria bacterium]|nr:DMT family transporter [Candidatus Woesebacteria bacterium]
MNPARRRAYIELLVVSVIWGFATPVIKYTLGGFSPAVFLTYRFFISAVLALIIFAITGFKFPKNPKTLALTLFNGFLISTVSLGLLFLGTSKTTSIDSNLISTMAPIMIALAGVFFLKERVTKREAVGILIALAGTLITIIEPVLKSGNGFSGLEGNLLVTASVVVVTITAVLAKIILRDNVDALTATNLSFVVGFITILPVALLGNSPTHILNTIYSAPLSYHLGVFYMAILSGTVAYFLWHRAEKTIEISEVNLIDYLYPIFGTPLSVFWLGEKITPPFVIGAVVIATGVFLAEWKKRRYN